jgi:hypothetical protein
LRRNFGWPLALGIVAGGVGVALGLRNFYVIMCADSLRLRHADDFDGVLPRRPRDQRALRLQSAVFLRAQLTMRNTRRYGGYVVHFGIVLIFIGIAGTAFNQDKQMEMPVPARRWISAPTI